MLSLTRREQMLIVSVLLTFAAGLAIKQWRDIRQVPALAVESPNTP